jgi:hypothetical protein
LQPGRIKSVATQRLMPKIRREDNMIRVYAGRRQAPTEFSTLH